MGVVHVTQDGSLHVRARLTIPAAEVEVRATTSGGPGGQHANRSLTKIVAVFDVRASRVMREDDRDLLIERCGALIQATSSRHRSQAANKSAALDALARKIGAALSRPTPRRPTRPTRSSQIRRVDEKKARSRVKQSRRGLQD